jgi:hypothetical protein
LKSKKNAHAIFLKNHPDTNDRLFGAFNDRHEEYGPYQYTKKNQEFSTLSSYQEHLLKEEAMERYFEQKYGFKRNTDMEDPRLAHSQVSNKPQRGARPEENRRPEPALHQSARFEGDAVDMLRSQVELRNASVVDSRLEHSGGQNQARPRQEEPYRAEPVHVAETRPPVAEPRLITPPPKMEQDILQSRVEDRQGMGQASRAQPAMASPEDRQKTKKSNPMIYGHYPLSGKESLKTAQPGKIA